MKKKNMTTRLKKPNEPNRAVSRTYNRNIEIRNQTHREFIVLEITQWHSVLELGTGENKYPNYFSKNLSEPIINCLSGTLRTVRIFKYLFLFFKLSIIFVKRKKALRISGVHATINHKLFIFLHTSIDDPKFHP